MKERGFSLIELLVVIAVMAMLVTIALPNYVSARARARDAQKKAALDQMKKALRMYYNDYQRYPALISLKYIGGCGTSGTEACATETSTCPADFVAGGSDGCSAANGATIYMKKFPDLDPDPSTIGWNYRVSGDGDRFYLFVRMENASDPDLVASQSRCNKGMDSFYANCESFYYCVCDD